MDSIILNKGCTSDEKVKSLGDFLDIDITYNNETVSKYEKDQLLDRIIISLKICDLPHILSFLVKYLPNSTVTDKLKQLYIKFNISKGGLGNSLDCDILLNI